MAEYNDFSFNLPKISSTLTNQKNGILSPSIHNEKNFISNSNKFLNSDPNMLTANKIPIKNNS